MKVSKRIMARAASGIAVLLFALAASIVVLAQEAGSNENYAIFVSQRNGAAELYVLDLNTRQVSQLTNTGRGHLTPAISGSRDLVFASREGSNYELFSASRTGDDDPQDLVIALPEFRRPRVGHVQSAIAAFGNISWILQQAAI